MARRRHTSTASARSSSSAPPRRSWCPPARAAWARPPPPPRSAAIAATHLGGKVLVLTVDPARRLASALGLEQFGNVETRVPDEAFADAGRRARGRAVGRHARHQAVVGRPHPVPCPRRRDPRRHPGQPAVPEHHRQVRPEPRLRRDGAALRDPLLRSLRPDRGRHPTDPERHRLPRRSGPHGRLLLAPIAALADHAVPVAPGQLRVEALLLRRRPDPRLAVPGGHRRVLHPVPDDVRRLRRAGRGGDDAPCGDRRTTFLVVSTLEVAPARRPTSSSSPRARRLPPRRAGAEQGAARLPGRAEAAARAVGRGRLAPDLAEAIGPTLAECRRTRRWSPGVLGEVGESFLNYQVVARREAEQRSEMASLARDHRVGALLRRATSATWPGCSGSANRSGAESATLVPMASLAEFAHVHTRLDTPEIDHLQRLVASWGLLADLCFADLLLFTAADGVDDLVVLGPGPAADQPDALPVGLGRHGGPDRGPSPGGAVAGAGRDHRRRGHQPGLEGAGAGAVHPGAVRGPHHRRGQPRVGPHRPPSR